MSQAYVVRFAFDENGRVLLMEKQKPEWQKGFWNGVGGKIEKGEYAKDAICREFYEETGVTTSVLQWRLFCILKGGQYPDDWKVYCYSINIEADQPKQQEEEIIAWYDHLPENIIDNLKWLVPMARASSKVFATAIED